MRRGVRPGQPGGVCVSGAAPVIILGMHRSGTTLVCRLLEEAGLFVGREKEANNESTFFLRINDWILDQAGARWDQPEPFAALLADADLSAAVEAQMRFLMSAERTDEFLGRPGDLQALDRPWGWKDPRTMLTLPLWLRLFPDARIIHVRRHGLDVAVSLLQRSRAALRAWPGRVKRFEDKRATDSARCLSLPGAFGLWSAYMGCATAYLAAFRGPLLDLRFEDLLADPAARCAELAAFACVSFSPGQLERLVGSIRADRAHSYRGDQGLAAYAGEVGPALRQYGYDG